MQNLLWNNKYGFYSFKQRSLFTRIHHRRVASGFLKKFLFFPLFILQIWDVTGAQHGKDCACNYEELRIKSECFLSAHSALLVNTSYVYSCPPLCIFFSFIVINKNQTSFSQAIFKKKLQIVTTRGGTKQMLDFCVTDIFGFYCY